MSGVGKRQLPKSSGSVLPLLYNAVETALRCWSSFVCSSFVPEFPLSAFKFATHRATTSPTFPAFSGLAMDAAALGGAEQGARRSARTMPSPVRSPPAIQQQD